MRELKLDVSTNSVVHFDPLHNCMSGIRYLRDVSNNDAQVKFVLGRMAALVTVTGWRSIEET